MACPSRRSLASQMDVRQFREGPRDSVRDRVARSELSVFADSQASPGPADTGVGSVGARLLVGIRGPRSWTRFPTERTSRATPPALRWCHARLHAREDSRNRLPPSLGVDCDLAPTAAVELTGEKSPAAFQPFRLLDVNGEHSESDHVILALDLLHKIGRAHV